MLHLPLKYWIIVSRKKSIIDHIKQEKINKKIKKFYGINSFNKVQTQCRSHGAKKGKTLLAYLGCNKVKATAEVKTTLPAGAMKCINCTYWKSLRGCNTDVSSLKGTLSATIGTIIKE
jgi:hypothetical protein